MEESEDAYEEEDEEYGREGQGLSPFPLPHFPLPPLEEPSLLMYVLTP